MSHGRVRRVAARLGFVLILLAPVLGAGAGVFWVQNNMEHFSGYATAAANLSEQIQVLAAVVAQASVPDADIHSIHDGSLEAAAEANTLMGRLTRAGVDHALVTTLDRHLTEYLASLALADTLFGQGQLPSARALASSTYALVPPMRVLATTLVTSLQHDSSVAARVGRILIGVLMALSIGAVTGPIALLERRRKREAVRNADYAAASRFEAIVQNSEDVLFLTDLSGVITFASPALTNVLGWERDSVVGQERPDLIDPDDAEEVGAAFRRVAERGGRETLDCRIRHADGSWRTMEAQIARISDKGEPAMLWTSRDVTVRRELEEQLSRQASEDPLTGLANRTLLHDRLTRAIARSVRSGNEVAVLLLDLDGFKEINDSFGHPAGDALVIDVADRLVRAVREGDTVARFGGDEFVIVAEATDALAVATEIAERIRQDLSNGVHVGNATVRMTASVGVVAVRGQRNVDDVIRDADVAMYEAKANGRDAVVVFAPKMLEGAQTKVELSRDLDRALDGGQLHVHFQPIFRLKTMELVGAEALLRWQHPERGALAPDRFIPIAERSGAIIPIGRWVLAEACGQAARWLEAGYSIESMHVNVSVHQLAHRAFVADVAAALAGSGIDPHLLVLELTESVFMADSRTSIERLTALRELGVRIAIDDFGTGYSSLARLSNLPIDVVKIDRSFVFASAVGNPSDRTLLDGILSLTGDLHLETVAEGIERVSELEEMRRSGCEFGQGYLLGRPMPASEFPGQQSPLAELVVSAGDLTR